MGNRANVIFVNKDETLISPCVYLHWNGGPESIYAFLRELERRNCRADQNYECARFIEVVADFCQLPPPKGRGFQLSKSF